MFDIYASNISANAPGPRLTGSPVSLLGGRDSNEDCDSVAGYSSVWQRKKPFHAYLRPGKRAPCFVAAGSLWRPRYAEVKLMCGKPLQTRQKVANAASLFSLSVQPAEVR